MATNFLFIATTVPGSSSWNSTTTTTSQKKSLREIQSEEISRNKKVKVIHYTWNFFLI